LILPVILSFSFNSQLVSMIYVTRKEHFNAAHRLYNPAWTDEKNSEVFGPCANYNFHGHNFELIVTVKGTPDPNTGFVIDLKVLGDIIKSEVIEKVDHKNLNLDVDFMQGKMASCEIFVMELWKILFPAIAKAAPNAKLHYIKLIETPKNFVEYYGE
jgi:6-pyruvoyltetrahydropterin/6-carboxytetrahydropterin synthase